MQQRRKYSQEYKLEAVQLVLKSDIPISQIATSLGINNNMLRRWVKEHAEPNKPAFTGHGSPRNQELAALRQCMSYAIGHWRADTILHSRLHITLQQTDKTVQRFNRYGKWSLLFSWVPIIWRPTYIYCRYLKN